MTFKNPIDENFGRFIGAILITVLLLDSLCYQPTLAHAKEYYYTRTRENPNHLRVSEEFKNNYVNEVKYESRINGTKYEYYKSSLSMSHDELVFETIDKIFRHRLSPFYVHHYDNEEDKKRSSDPNLVSAEACTRDLMYLVDKLPKRFNYREPYTNNDEDHLSPELTAFFDSYARQEAGLLMGNTYWVGAYDQCVNRHIFELTSSHPDRLQRHHRTGLESELKESHNLADDQKVVNFKGRYCVSSLKSPTWDSIIKAKKVSARKYFKSQRQFNDYSKLFRLQVGICLPSSCDSTSYERHAEEIKLLTTSMLEQRYADYELIDLYCLPDETSPLRSWSGSAINFMVFVSLWLVLVFTATVVDLLEFATDLDATNAAKGGCRRSKLRQFVAWFSLRSNYRKLMHVKEGDAKQDHSNEKCSSKDKVGGETVDQQQNTNNQDNFACSKNNEKQTLPEPNSEGHQDIEIDLRFLNAFKVMIMFWIVNGHIMLLMIQTAKNILNSDALLNGLMHFLIGATFGVDLFFTMTGFLTSYLIFNSGHAYKMKPTTWIYLSFHRYWRLAPMYLLTFWFSRSVMQMLGSGPLWDYGTSNLTFRGLCNHESWWYPMTLTSNLHGLFEECMITSWYISCDMQFWLVSPLFIYLLAKHPLHGWMASICTILMSSKVRFDAILTDQSARYDELVQPRADIFMRVSHDLPALYTHPHYRIAAYIVGLLAGHYVYMIKSGKWKSSIANECRARQQVVAATMPSTTIDDDIPSAKEAFVNGKTPDNAKSNVDYLITIGNIKRNTIAYTGLFLFLAMSFVSYLLSHYYPTSLLRYAKSVAAIAYSLDHLVMSVGASFVIIAMCFGQWSNIVKFLSHPNWTRLSKINYALLLLQCEAIYYQIFRYDQVPVAGTRELINILFNLLVTLYPLAYVVTLVFEFPLANIEKLLL